MVWGSDVLMGRGYLAIRGAKPKAEIRSERKQFGETHRVHDLLERGEWAAEMAVALYAEL
jgi:hypothetical protein